MQFKPNSKDLSIGIIPLKTCLFAYSAMSYGVGRVPLFFYGMLPQIHVYGIVRSTGGYVIHLYDFVGFYAEAKPIPNSEFRIPNLKNAAS